MRGRSHMKDYLVTNTPIIILGHRHRLKAESSVPDRAVNATAYIEALRGLTDLFAELDIQIGKPLLAPQAPAIVKFVYHLARRGALITLPDLVRYLEAQPAPLKVSDIYTRLSHCQALSDDPDLPTIEHRAKDPVLRCLTSALKSIHQGGPQYGRDALGRTYKSIKTGAEKPQDLATLNTWILTAHNKVSRSTQSAAWEEAPYTNYKEFKQDYEAFAAQAAKKGVDPTLTHPEASSLPYYRHLAYVSVNPVNINPHETFSNDFTVPSSFYCPSAVKIPLVSGKASIVTPLELF